MDEMSSTASINPTVMLCLHMNSISAFLKNDMFDMEVEENDNDNMILKTINRILPL